MDRVLTRHFNVQAEGQVSLRWAIMYDYNNKVIKNKSQKQFQHGVRTVFSLQQNLNLTAKVI